MTVETTEIRIPYSGNGTTTIFPVPFQFIENADVKVDLVSSTGVVTPQVLGTHYTLTGADVDTGGTLTMTTAPAGTETLIIYLEPRVRQPLDLTLAGLVALPEIERALDRITLISQWLKENVTRSLRFALSDTSGVSTTLPTPVASKLIGFDATAAGLTTYSASDLVAVTVSARSEWIDDDGDSDGVTAAYTDQGSTGYELSVDTSNLTALFHVGRRVKIEGTATGTVYGWVAASNYNSTIAGKTYVRLTAGLTTAAGALATLSNEALTVWAGIASFVNPSVAPHRLTPQMLGAKADGVAEDTAILQAWAGINVPRHLPDGTYICKKQLTFTGTVDLTFGDAILDFSSATVSGDFPDSACVYFNAGALTAIVDLTTNVSDGDSDLVFTSAPAIEKQDILVIYDPTDGSFNNIAAHYRKGEMLRVNYRSGTTVKVHGGTLDSYVAATVDCYKLPKARASVRGVRLHVINPTAVDTLKGIQVVRYSDSTFDNIGGEQGGHSNLNFKQCYNVTGRGLGCYQTATSSLGLHYGAVVSNCQKVILEGDFFGWRRGLILGGGDEAGAVPCREIEARGMFACGPDEGFGAFGAHGNCEHYTAEGIFRGGIFPAGDYGTFRGQIITPYGTQAGVEGRAVQATELLGMSFDFSGMKVVAYGDPMAGGGGKGTIDFGGNSVAMGADTVRGGVLNLSHMQITAPDSNCAIRIRNRGATPSERMVIDISHTVCTDLAVGLTNAVLIDAVSGSDFHTLTMDGFNQEQDPAYSIANVTRIRGWRQTGTVSVTTSTGAPKVTQAVTFARKAPKAPHVTVSITASGVGGAETPTPGQESPTTTGFTAALRTPTGANFTANEARTVTFVASLDE